jgi:hypothetical protein
MLIKYETITVLKDERQHKQLEDKTDQNKVSLQLPHV